MGASRLAGSSFRAPRVYSWPRDVRRLAGRLNHRLIVMTGETIKVLLGAVDPEFISIRCRHTDCATVRLVNEHRLQASINKALGEYVQIPRIFQRKLDSCGGFTVKGGQSSAIRAEVEPASRIRTDARAQPNRFEDCARPGEIVCVPDRQDCE